MIKIIRVDPAIFKDNTKSLKEILKEVNNMTYEILSFEEVEEVESYGRNRGLYDEIVKNFQTQVTEATEGGETKFGISVDLNGKSVAAVRAGLAKAVEKANREDFRVIAKNDAEKVYLIWKA